jgi:hypothetical protein
MLSPDELQELARQANGGFYDNLKCKPAVIGLDALAKFAELVAAREREECAKVCDDMIPGLDNNWNRGIAVAQDLIEVVGDCANAIRSRA